MRSAPTCNIHYSESLPQAALRETLEETGWIVGLTGVLGLALYTAPTNGATYYRTTFLADPVSAEEGAELDPDITAVHWLTYEDIVQRADQLRSPLVLASIERHRRGLCFPLELFYR